MKILVIGSGGREHAVIAALKKSKYNPEIFCAPGNGGIASLATCCNTEATDINGIVNLAEKLNPDWVFVAPDDPLVLGAVDALNERGFKTFGPTQSAALLEGSKVFAKGFMKKYDVPTADYETFESFEKALAYIKEKNAYPIVIKCDGLALGKGVIIAQNLTEAEEALKSMLIESKFGESGKTVVIEEFLEGAEFTILAFADGKTIVPAPSCADHKRALDGDKGKNTGGMGVISPVKAYAQEIAAECMEKIFIPTINGMAQEGRNFKGCLYFGLILTSNGAKVVEYNCRFGDPEAQVILPLLETDLIDIMNAIWEEKLSEIEIKFSDEASACVIMASKGYPESYAKNLPLSGLNSEGQIADFKASDNTNVCVFHAGTRKEGNSYLTSGGRVLGITAVSGDLKSALNEAYSAVKKIDVLNKEILYYRRDIGEKYL